MIFKNIFQGHTTLKDCILDDTLLPAIMPVGEYYAQFILSAKLNKIDQYAAQFRLYFDVRRKSWSLYLSINYHRRNYCQYTRHYHHLPVSSFGLRDDAGQLQNYRRSILFLFRFAIDEKPFTWSRSSGQSVILFLTELRSFLIIQLYKPEWMQ